MTTRILLAPLFLLAACSGETPSDTTPDAAGGSGATVQAVTCPTGTLPSIATTGSGQGGRYMPMSVTVAVGGIVKFTTTEDHNVLPNIRMSDPGLRVGLSETKCLKFTQAGTFGFNCGPHGFQGTIIVQ